MNPSLALIVVARRTVFCNDSGLEESPKRERSHPGSADVPIIWKNVAGFSKPDAFSA